MTQKPILSRQLRYYPIFKNKNYAASDRRGRVISKSDFKKSYQMNDSSQDFSNPIFQIISKTKSDIGRFRFMVHHIGYRIIPIIKLRLYTNSLFFITHKLFVAQILSIVFIQFLRFI